MTEDHSYELASQAIQTLGASGGAICEMFKNTGSTVFTGAADIGKAAFGAVGKIAQSGAGIINNTIDSIQKVKLQKLQNELAQMDMEHSKEMQKLQNKHDEKMLKMRIEHEEFIISEQRKVFEKMIEAASAAYTQKIDFFRAQLTCLNETYKEESKMLENHIEFLEKERRDCMDDPDKYVLISSDINKLHDKKDKIYGDYLEAQGQLQDAIQYLEIDAKYGNALEASQKNLLENRS